MGRRLTKPVRVSFMARAGDKIILVARKKMTKPIKISFMAKGKPRKV